MAQENTAERKQSPISSITVSGAPEGVDALWVAQKAKELMRDDRIVVHVTLNDQRVQTLKSCIEFFEPEAQVLIFPAWDCLPYDRVSPRKDITAQRVATLCQLLDIQEEAKRRPRIVLTTINAITQKVPPAETFKDISLSAKKGKSLDIDSLQNFLINNGYERTQTVREAGEYAIRGGIIDIFPSEEEDPVRLDLFGDEIESIRVFDPETQMTTKQIETFEILPAREYFLNDKSVEMFRRHYRDHFGMHGANDPIYEAVTEKRQYAGIEHWLPFFYEEMDTLIDYMDNPFLVFDQQSEHSREERLDQINDFYQARQSMMQAHLQKKKKSTDVSVSGSVYRPIPTQSLYLDHAAWQSLMGDIEKVALSSFQASEIDTASLNAGGKKGRNFSDIRALPDGDVFKALQDYLKDLSGETVIAAYSEGSKDRLKALMDAAQMAKAKDIEHYDEIKKLHGALGIAVLPLEEGFTTDAFNVITEQDLLGDRLTRTTKTKKKKADNFISEVSSLSEGDYVVHVDFGIGKFMGLETLEAGGILHDCLKLVYAGDDRLYLPVENIDMLSRFGGEDAIVQLDKLGGVGWQARKARVKKNLMEMADELLKIAAARQLKKADKLDVSEGVYNEFAARFPYHETEDQLRAINETLGDMAQGMPMDRLVCGDVGFGKTEIALRAAFVAAMSGVQVAIVAPTTLLARQHHQNFLKRFEGMGLRVEQLSRMVTTKEAQAVKEGLKDGSVNIVIGTHALFSKDVSFQKLGLLIVDEEQRFGVKQKEKLKSLKEDVHVLTLTATPIPRTLQMSLTGVKELSIIATPPVDRLAVRTYVMPFDGMVIREALLREHYRGGQSFYVCPRVKDIEKVHEELKELVPEVKIITAHGQLSPTDLDNRMTAFYNREYDVLLATNIIESGLDVPTANTMIVHRADLFGLAQLYQIRGRVGRSKLRAYAYLTYDGSKRLSDTAQKRLEVLETLDTLGAGFQLASHDMDIRGAGNLLGEQQSGHIKEVGVELYQQMLEEAVAAARDGVGFDDVAEMSWSPVIQLGTSVLIPETYVEDLNLRMSLYRRLGSLESESEIEQFAAELIDRFGRFPDEVENLLEVVKIKLLSKQAGIEKIEAGPKGAVITFHKSFSKPQELVALMQSKPTLKLRPDQKLVRVASWNSLVERVNGVKLLAKELAEL